MANHQFGGPSRITGGSIVQSSGIGGVGHSDQLKYGGVSTMAGGSQLAVNPSGARSNSYAQRAPASSHGTNHQSQRAHHSRHNNMQSRE